MHAEDEGAASAIWKCSVRCPFVYDKWSDPMEVAGSERWQQTADDVAQKVTKSGGAELYAAVGS